MALPGPGHPQLRGGDPAPDGTVGTPGLDRRGGHPSGRRQPPRRLGALLRPRRVRGQARVGGCYCLEPHVRVPDEDPTDVPHWQDNRTAMLARLRGGRSHGYLAYVDGTPGRVGQRVLADRLHAVPGRRRRSAGRPGRGHLLLHHRAALPTARDRRGTAGPGPGGCGRPWRRLGRGLPVQRATRGRRGAFRGPRSMYDARGFEPIRTADRHTVVRRRP
jgi:hypothetical protein